MAVVADHPYLEHGGEVAEGYESVRDLFLSNFEPGGQEDRAQLCVFVQGKKVVDLWGSRVQTEERKWGAKADEQPYRADSLQNIFSSTKVLTSIVVAMLVDRGHLAYDQLVTDIWEEYAQCSKGTTTIAMLMRHEAGLAQFDQPLSVADLTADTLSNGRAGDIIAGQKPSHVPGAERNYHGVTRGWIVNEIVRRVDPQHRTIGQFLLEEISTPLNMRDELRIGLPDNLHSRVAPLVRRSGAWSTKQWLFPKVFGGGRIVGFSVGARVAGVFLAPILALPALMAGTVFAIKGSKPFLSHPDIDKNVGGMELWNTPELRRSEIPSANGHASARALATVAVCMVEGGGLPDGSVRLLSAEGVEAAQAQPIIKKMFMKNFEFTNAGLCNFKESRFGYTGWMGMGGSVCQWHNEEKIAFGYAMNCMELVPSNARAAQLQKEVLACASRLRAASKAAT